MSNCLDPDQGQDSVNPDLGPNCLQRLSADDKSCGYQGKSFVQVESENVFPCFSYLTSLC